MGIAVSVYIDEVKRRLDMIEKTIEAATAKSCIGDQLVETEAVFWKILLDLYFYSPSTGRRNKCFAGLGEGRWLYADDPMWRYAAEFALQLLTKSTFTGVEVAFNEVPFKTTDSYQLCLFSGRYHLYSNGRYIQAKDFAKGGLMDGFLPEMKLLCETALLPLYNREVDLEIMGGRMKWQKFLDDLNTIDQEATS